MTDSAIEVTGVARSFGAVHAVRDATFTAAYGSVTALIGPNGSGKTTLMLMLASLLTPDAGSIRIAGHDPVTDPRAVRAAMGWMPDVLGSWASLPVRKTLEITGRLHGLSAPAAAARAAELIDLTGLQPLASQPTRVLSRGQKQKLSLARSLVHDPKVLLLDEPASGLDPAARIELRLLVRRLADEGRSLLISSHVLAELDEMADAAVYVEAGATVSAERVGRAKTSLRQWRIRAVDAATVVPALEARGIERDRIGRDHLGTLVAVASETEAAAVLTALVGAGVAVSSFAPVVGDLEHTFLDLTRGGAGAQPVADDTETLS
ncbi:ABC transporter ATP-binding protein [Herbiconiux sp. L3-i23]|uniref:ABC transporter ATP-binding protein n=1 Tax=Herbiconiux sp. L3-i23 TaxID=2905871 RepID=UPI0020503796|nr:ABC transporter ATP-binding protein [Herbiconiux sp. L3-i23]BDI23597.1 multidrug ABC transporter ATP-binding protein [Herbiconiux sp. L3-i23]